MTKADFVSRLSADGRFRSRKEAADALDAILESIGDELGRRGSISLTGFGKFHVADRAARRGVNPRTGESIQIAGGPVPRFTAGSALKAKVKQGSPG